MKTKIKCILPVLFLILGAPQAAKATLVNSSFIIEEGLEYYIELDRFVYDLGEPIEILCRVINIGTESLNVSDLGLSYTISFELETPTGDTLFAPSFITEPRLPGFPQILTLNSGEYIETRYNITSLTGAYAWGAHAEVVDNPFTTVGEYTISSKFNNDWFFGAKPASLEPDALNFVVIPEPASILLLTLGLTSLLVRKEGKVKCAS